MLCWSSCTSAPPRQHFDTTPIANLELALPLAVSQNSEDNEDPTLIMGRDRQFYVVWSASWTSGRSSPEGAILVRDLATNPAPILQLTTGARSGYSGKIVPADQPGEYLMVWTGRDGKLKIFSKRFRL